MIVKVQFELTQTKIIKYVGKKKDEILHVTRVRIINSAPRACAILLYMIIYSRL